MATLAPAAFLKLAKEHDGHDSHRHNNKNRPILSGRALKGLARRVKPSCGPLRAKPWPRQLLKGTPRRAPVIGGMLMATLAPAAFLKLEIDPYCLAEL
jgi:hypothetical protein